MASGSWPPGLQSRQETRPLNFDLALFAIIGIFFDDIARDKELDISGDPILRTAIELTICLPTWQQVCIYEKLTHKRYWTINSQFFSKFRDKTIPKIKSCISLPIKKKSTRYKNRCCQPAKFIADRMHSIEKVYKVQYPLPFRQFFAMFSIIQKLNGSLVRALCSPATMQSCKVPPAGL